MAQETQNNFSGGLNTRYPAHQIAENQATELTDVDLSYGDLRGDYGMAPGGFQDYYYEEGGTWVSNSGFNPTIAVTTWPYSGNNVTQAISANSNFFSVVEIGTNSVITINDGVVLEVIEFTNGVFGANSFVEYNQDLYISRSNFDITATYSSSSNTTTLATGDDTFKLQVGDIVEKLDANGAVEADIVANSFITEVNDVANTVTINNPVTATQSSAVTLSVRPIISRFLDGVTSAGFRASALQPDPVITFAQDSNLGNHTERDGKHSDSWYASNYAVPFQYGLAHFDSTGIESSMAEMTDSKISATYFSSATSGTGTSINSPQYLSISGVRSSTSLDNKNGRYALYRVGGSSSVIKRVANLFFDGIVIAATKQDTNSNGTAETLRVAITSANNSHQYRVAWYVYSTGTSYAWTNADGTSVSATTTGQTDFRSPSSNTITFDLTGTTASHYADVFVWVRIPGENIEREYVNRAFTFDNASVNIAGNATNYRYIDFTPSDSLIDIQPIEEKNEPERSLKFLTESGNLFFAAKGTRVFVSEYGNPNSWPASAFVDFDQEVTALDSLGAELVVFTNYGIYRVFGTDPKNLKRIQIPTTEGVPAGLDKCVTRYQGGLMFVSHNGICFYDGKQIQRLSHNSLDTFTAPDSTNANNCAGFFEDVYYLMGNTGTGYKFDIRSNPPKLTRTSMTSSNLYYRGAVNTLYSPNGRPGYPTGLRQAFTATTRGFAGGDVNKEKVCYSFNVSASNFKGTVKFLANGVVTDTFTVTNAVADFDRTFYLSTPRRFNFSQVQFVSCEGEVNRATVNFDFTDQLTDRLFSSVQVQYTGTPTISVAIDTQNKLTQTLPAPTDVIGEAKLYFPPMSNGVVACIKEDSNEENGRILNYSYDAQAV